MRNRATLRLLAALFTLTTVAAACSDDDPVEVGAGADPSDADAPDADASDADASDADMADADMADADMADADMDHDDDMADADHDDMADMDHDDMDGMDDGAAHEHGESVDVTGDVVPTIDIEVTSDPAGGVNVQVLTTDYTISPQAASTEHVEGEGHFHAYVDGVKVQRFYNECIHIPGVVEGEVDIEVELSANDHRPYAADGVPIAATVLFDVPAHGHDEHSHDEAVATEWDGAGEPSLGVEVVDDPKSGWNAWIDVVGLDISCENASGDHVAGQGHLHIYANGEKLGRLYGTATHIAALPAGEVEITVAAYTNDHQPYVVAGAPVEASTTITVAAPA